MSKRQVKQSDCCLEAIKLRPYRQRTADTSYYILFFWPLGSVTLRNGG